MFRRVGAEGWALVGELCIDLLGIIDNGDVEVRDSARHRAGGPSPDEKGPDEARRVEQNTK